MASIRYGYNRDGFMYARINVVSKEPNTGLRKDYYKKIININNISELKFRKMVEKSAYEFEYETRKWVETEMAEIKKIVEEAPAKIENIRNCIEAMESKQGNHIFKDVADEWLEHVKKDLSISYYERGIKAKNLFNDYLERNDMEYTALEDIGVKTIQNFLDEFEGQSVDTVKGHRRILHTIFQEAVRYEYISRNPVTNTRITSNNAILRPVEIKEVFTIEEAKEFVNNCDNFPPHLRTYRMAFKTMLFTGIRSAEMAGLKWSDIDFEKRILKVRRNRMYNPRVGIYIKAPKTKTSIRDIPIPDILYDELHDYYQWYSNRLENFEEKKDDCYLFVTEEMNPAFPKQLQKAIETYCKKYKVKKHITCHALRHTYCSILLAQNVPIQTVTNYMGHSNSTVTLRVYTHFIADTQTLARDAFNKLF